MKFKGFYVNKTNPRQYSYGAVYSNKEKGMIIKMDIANTFDHARHSFLFKVLKKIGGNEFFMTMIQSYTSTP